MRSDKFVFSSLFSSLFGSLSLGPDLVPCSVSCLASSPALSFLFIIFLVRLARVSICLNESEEMVIDLKNTPLHFLEQRRCNVEFIETEAQVSDCPVSEVLIVV